MNKLFDEQWYLSHYPDIGKAVTEDRSWNSGYDHYTALGKAAGRLPYEFDEQFYRGAYPLASIEVEAGLASDLRSHYEAIGWRRGYLPHREAERKDNPELPDSRFGGLWPDMPRALDVIAGRLEIGQITEEQADLLRSWIRNGYVILSGAIPDHEQEPALADLEKAYSGGFGSLKFACDQLARGHQQWVPQHRDLPAKALDLHWYSPAIRDVMFSARVRSFLHLIFESKALASQSLGFYRGSAQDAHQDSAYVPYTLQRHFAASWIALEDVHVGGGELYYFEGSNRLADYVYGGQYKSVVNARRSGVPNERLETEIRDHVRQLPVAAKAEAMPERTFIAKRGDVLIWHADLAHGGKPISTTQSRRSVVTHYCPWRLVPLYFEGRQARLRDHVGKGFFTSQHY